MTVDEPTPAGIWAPPRTPMPPPAPAASVAEATVAEPAPPPPAVVPVRLGSVELVLDAIDTLYYAVAHRPVVRSLTIRNIDLDPAAGDLVVVIAIEGATATPLLHELSFEIPALAVRDEATFRAIRIEPNHRELAILDEQLTADLVVTVAVGGTVVGITRRSITFLAYNQWMHRLEFYDSFAAFVMPNHPSLGPVMERARALLGERTGIAATEGYQSRDPGRVRMIAEAVFDALSVERFAYTDPPASFEGYGQRIRTPDIIFSDRCGTCLDTAVLFASCLAAAGLDTVLVLTTGHALAGYWNRLETVTAELAELMRRPVLDNPNDVAALMAAGALVAVETTFVTVSEPERTFAEAIESTRSLSTDRTREIEAVVNVAAARAAGVRPIPSRRIIDGVLEIESLVDTSARIEAQPALALLQDTATLAANHIPNRLEAFDAPPRIRSWLNSLLDLSFANPLINLKPGRATFRFDLPPGMLDRIEDRLMAHDGSIELRPASRVPSRVLDQPSLSDALMAEFASSGTIFYPDVATLDPAIDSTRRALLGGDPTLAPAQATRAAEDAVAAAMQQDLDASMVALRRKAREIESQSGSNNLFLTIGAMSWTEPPVPGARARHDRATAPLFLIPVRITGSAATSYRITADEGVEVTPNYCLLEKLRQTFGLVIPELETPNLDETGIDVAGTFAAIRAALGQQRLTDVVVEESAHLAVLNFATFRLWKDMRDHWQQFIGNDVVRHLVERPYEAFENVATGAAQGELLCPIEIDESQLDAVRWAVEGRSFVIEGPPGTGKSQTITNLLAACIAANKRVLFVAEKQPALQVVKKRLEQIGLTPFCIDLHDKGSKPEQIRKQVRDALDFAGVDREAEWEDLSARLASDDQALAAYRSVIHTPNDAGYSAWSARQEMAEIGPGPGATVPADFLAHTSTRLVPVRDALLALPSVVGALRLDPGAAWTLSTVTDFGLIDQAAMTSLVLSMQTTLNGLAALPNSVRQALALTQSPSDLAVVTTTLGAAQAATLPTDAELAVIGSNQWIAARDAARQRLDALGTTLAPLRALFHDSVFAADLRSVIDAGAEAVSAGIFTRGKRERSFHVLLTPFLRAEPSISPAALLSAIQQIEPVKAEIAGAIAQIDAIAGVRTNVGWSPLREADVSLASHQLSSLPASAAVLRSPVATATRAALGTGWTPDAACEDLLGDARSAWQTLTATLAVTPASLERWRNGRGLFEAWSASNPAWISSSPRLLALQRWGDVIATMRPLEDAGLHEFVDDLLHGRVDVDGAYDQFRRGLVSAALAERLDAGRVDQFDGLAHDRRVQSFITRSAERRELMRSIIPFHLTRQRPFTAGARFGEYGALERELSKTTRRLSIRRLIERYGEILPNMTPCFLMSPDSVARFIPPGSITFDLVVFDEASQIEVAEAIGAMGRAKAVVVVGDSRQMPPSTFGASTVDAEDGDLDDGTDPGDAVFADLESILSECVESNLPRLSLQCHYRSRHEALIAFSNAAFYEGKLTTFPSPFTDGPSPIHWRRIDGHFDRSGSGDDHRTNRAEADAIVADVLRRLDDPAISHQSICIVTLNVQQQSLVQRLLEASGDERIAELLDDESDRGLIVRNLESVQGDERDVVLISIAFAPVERAGAGGTTSRRLPLNFGPLNRKGGERRLNVAVTRARIEVTVFCSFDPEEMRLSENPAKGLQLLQQYLAIARDGSRSSGDLAARAPSAPDHHRAAVAAGLAQRGLRVRENVGLSKFRIDIAVAALRADTVDGPDEANTADAADWDVAVLLDGPGWASRTTVYDRDALPANVLTMMGWPRIVRVWLPSWIQEPERVLDQIEAAVASANVVPPPPPATAPVIPSTTTTAPPGAGWLPPGTVHIAAAPPAPARVVPSLETVFTAASIAPIGDRDVVDHLDQLGSRARVLGAIDETMSAEAPIHAGRLAKIVLTRFGFDRVTRARAAEIVDLATDATVRRSGTEIFLWPSDVDAETWRGYRRTPTGVDRPIEHIAPEEIVNAMTDIVAKSHTIETDELLRVTADIFGVRKLTAATRERLGSTLDGAVTAARLEVHDGRVRSAQPAP